MAVQTVYLASSVSGSNPAPQNAIGNTPSTWGGTSNNNTSWTHRWAFANPIDPELTGNQSMTVRVRKGSNSNNPTVTSINVYRGGTLVHTHSTTTTVTSTAGQDITFSWNGSGSSAGVDIEVITSSSGGSPSARNGVDMALASWIAQTAETNQRPVVVMMLNVGVEVGEPFTLNGSASYDPDGTIVKYEWIYDGQVIGTEPTLTRPPYQTPGLRYYTLRVTDDGGAVGTATATLNVIAPNLPPRLERTVQDPEGVVTVPESGSVPVYLEAIFVDPERVSEGPLALTYLWNTTVSPGMGSIFLSQTTSMFTTAEIRMPGNYTVRVTALDDQFDYTHHDFHITAVSAGTPASSNWSVVQDGSEVELPQLEGIVENGAISPVMVEIATPSTNRTRRTGGA